MRSLFLALLLALPSQEPPKGCFVAVGYGGRRLSSADGASWENDQSWSEKAADDDNVLFSVAWGKGTFVAVGGGARVGRLLTTRDGKEWKELPSQKGRVDSVAFGNGRFVATHGREFLWSEDGEAWQSGGKLDFKGSLHPRKCVFGNGIFVVIGDGDPSGAKRVSFRAMTKDGTSCDHFAAETPAARAVAFGAGRFVVVGPDGLCESSADGKTWEAAPAEPGESLSGVVWDGRRFLASGGKTAWTSPDGVRWTRESWRIPCHILYGSPGLYLGASWNGGLWQSADGVAWKRSNITSGCTPEAVAARGP